MALYVLSNSYPKPTQCIIRVGTVERVITTPYAFAPEVTVASVRNGATVARLRLTARRDRGGVREAGLFAPGEPILIEADFHRHREEVMRGFIRTLRADYEQGSRRPLQVSVECQDESLRLEGERVRRLWGAATPTSDRVIAAAILGKYGLTLDADSGEGAGGVSLRQDDTDLGFLRARAGANGYELLFYGGSVYFGPSRWQAKPQHRILVQDVCRQFAVRRAGGQTPDRVTLHHARGELNGHTYGRVLRVGEPVDVAGVGGGHDGIYYVDTVSHHFTAAGYRQSFTLLRRTCGAALDDITLDLASPAPGSLYQVL